MVGPRLLAVSMPDIVGFSGGAEMLKGLLAEVTVMGVLIVILKSNSIVVRNNAKKMFERGYIGNGKKYFKGSNPQKVAVFGDTLADPFKNTSGPSINILIKLMAVISLVIAPLIK